MTLITQLGVSCEIEIYDPKEWRLIEEIDVYTAPGYKSIIISNHFLTPMTLSIF